MSIMTLHCNYYEFTYYHFVFAIVRKINRSNYVTKIMLIKTTHQIN